MRDEDEFVYNREFRQNVSDKDKPSPAERNGQYMNYAS